ncbi:MAG: TlpA disulfide reductase family protein, partial [Candidatus Hydrogenedentales bacterium]
LDFWATWCPPCRASVPFLVELQEQHREEGLVVVGAAFEDGDSADARRDTARTFVEEKGINYLVLDGGGNREEIAEGVAPEIKEIHNIPTMFVIGRDGKVCYSSTGFSAEHKTKIKKAIAEALAEK